MWAIFRSIEFALGLILGIFGGFFLFAMTVLFGAKTDVNIISNIIIACATVVATAIHISSVKQQRKDRVWDMNKTILLDLSHSLVQVIDACSYYLDQEQMGLYNEDAVDNEFPRKDVFKKFEEKQDYVLTVYKTLMSGDLTSALQTAKNLNERIAGDVYVGVIDNIEAYTESIGVYEQLQKKTRFFHSGNVWS